MDVWMAAPSLSKLMLINVAFISMAGSEERILAAPLCRIENKVACICFLLMVFGAELQKLYFCS